MSSYYCSSHLSIFCLVKETLPVLPQFGTSFRKKGCVCLVCTCVKTCRRVTFSMQNVSACAYRALYAHRSQPACVSQNVSGTCVVSQHVCRYIHLASVSDWAAVCEA